MVENEPFPIPTPTRPKYQLLHGLRGSGPEASLRSFLAQNDGQSIVPVAALGAFIGFFAT